MGKHGKQRKRRKLEQAILLHKDLPSPQGSGRGDVAVSGNAPAAGTTTTTTTTVLDELALQTTMRFLASLVANPEHYHNNPQLRPLRSMIAQLPKKQALSGNTTTTTQSQCDNNPIQRISQALHEGNLADALPDLNRLHYLSVVPKLGTLCRWTRDLDAVRTAGTPPPPPPTTTRNGDDSTNQKTNEKVVEEEEVTTTMQEPNSLVIVVLDRILRLCHPTKYPYRPPVGRMQVNPTSFACRPLAIPQQPSSAAAAASSSSAAAAAAAGTAVQVTTEQEQLWKSKFRIIYTQQAAERQPPNQYDLHIWTSTENSLNLAIRPLDSTTTIERINVPNVEDAFMLTNVLSLEECQNILQAAESIGFQPDAPLVQGGGSGNSSSPSSMLAHAVVYLMDETMEQILWNRIKTILPNPLDGGYELIGINRRWRIYRYDKPHQAYRCHIDGAWTASGLQKDENGNDIYIPDVYSNPNTEPISSRFTFLLYLNEGFLGGETIYYRPCEMKEGVLLGTKVAPRAGCVMIFPHATIHNNPLHEGSAVLKGCKYIVRTEVLYKGFIKN